MIVLGLTGSIAMGKTAAARHLRRLRVPVFEADKAVHRLLGPWGKAVPLVAEAFPDAIVAGHIDRQRLGAQVFADRAALARLEAILHPLVRREERRFLQICRRRRRRVAVLDIPLLFETAAERLVDAVIVMSCPAFLQTQRVLSRPGMTLAKLAAIRARQLADSEKRRRADFVVPSSLGRRTSLYHLKRILARVRACNLPKRKPFRHA